MKIGAGGIARRTLQRRTARAGDDGVAMLANPEPAHKGSCWVQGAHERGCTGGCGAAPTILRMNDMAGGVLALASKVPGKQAAQAMPHV